MFPLDAVTKTMLPIVMGLESPRPGRATFQAFFNWVGILFSMENPFPSGPLKQGQSSAWIAKGRRRRLVMRSLRIFMLIKLIVRGLFQPRLGRRVGALG